MAADSGKTPPPPKERRAVSRARRNAELQIEYNEKMHRLAMLRRRIQLAQAGVHAYQAHKMAEAVKNFQAYITILEDWKGVAEGRLMPSNFDVKTDVAELLLISGVYWDMAKHYDRTKSPDKVRQFRHYLEKYIIFSKNMPFQHVCLETMRKYVYNDKPIHRQDFIDAFKAMGGKSSPCFVATALADECDPLTLPRLRAFRDTRLARRAAGRAFIKWYYRNGPWMARLALRAPLFVRRVVARVLEVVARCV